MRLLSVQLLNKNLARLNRQDSHVPSTMLPFIIGLASVSAFDTSIIDTINNDKTATWTAGPTKFTGKTTEELKRMFSKELQQMLEDSDWEPFEFNDNSPKEFDARTEWPNKIQGVRDQGSCGSCWAFAGSSVLSDRFAIAGCGKGELSQQDLVSCDMVDMGCNGGNPMLEWVWMTLRGITTADCIPYVSGDGTVPKCPKKCANGTAITRHKANSFSQIIGPFIKNNLQSSGPQEVCFTVYEDFMSYRSGIYEHKTGEMLGGHAVKLVGWGEENGTKFWTCQNSWGLNWGESGYFRIKRGSNECGIEAMVFAGKVKC
ncbi:putative Gut-specific cysteine proteinase [Blattamonas nauphoetae]|uniref:Gut-specific cysteine proteinase n=1 Tax=Blattamonas nauphoetae TaxID=2049346 RepID=A0ABQ9XX41_9EUKA|nr:putative Gut-specific cysteine proteinase [Blattamonas nauphoetae]